MVKQNLKMHKQNFQHSGKNNLALPIDGANGDVTFDFATMTQTTMSGHTSNILRESARWLNTSGLQRNRSFMSP